MYATNMVVTQRGKQVQAVFENGSRQTAVEGTAANMLHWAREIERKCLLILEQ